MATVTGWNTDMVAEFKGQFRKVPRGLVAIVR